MPGYAYAIMVVGWLAWMVPFFLVSRQKQPAKKVDTKARWGIVLVAVGYALLWLGHFRESTPPVWRTVLCAVFFALAALLSWTGALALGKQWRFDAGLTADHELVRSGAYRVVRHPIYASMFCTLLAMGFLITPWKLFLPAIFFFILGTEIRIRVEEKLLSARFGEEFAEFKRRVPAYIPFVR